MWDMFFHTVVNILWLIILTAAAAIVLSIAFVVVKVVFFDARRSDNSNSLCNTRKE